MKAEARTTKIAPSHHQKPEILPLPNGKVKSAGSKAKRRNGKDKLSRKASNNSDSSTTVPSKANSQASARKVYVHDRVLYLLVIYLFYSFIIISIIIITNYYH